MPSDLSSPIDPIEPPLDPKAAALEPAAGLIPAAIAAAEQGQVARRRRRAPAAPLGHGAARGVAMNLVVAICGKFISVGGQIALSWLLGAADYGYVGLALMVATFAALLQQGGLREVLIQRGRSFDRWVNAAFWMSAAFGGVSTILMLLWAPLAAYIYHDRRLIPLIGLFAIQNIINSLNVVPEARLMTDLRFRLMAALGLVQIVLMTSLSVLFAALHFGAYSFVLPFPIVALVRILLLWPIARLPVRFDMELRKWRFLIGNNLMLIAGEFLLTITYQGDYLILGWLWSKEVVGHYFWAFNMSVQSLAMFTVGMAGVLVPSLARLQDEPERQLNGFLRACRMIALVCVPACLLQAALAWPAVRLIFQARWHGDVPLIQILSIGWTFFVVSHPASSLMRARGMFATLMWTHAALATTFLVIVYAGARHGAAVGTATAVATYAIIGGPTSVYIAIRSIGGRRADVANIFVVPLLAGIAAVGSGWAVSQLLPVSKLGMCARIATVLAVSAGIYIPLIRRLARPTFDEILSRARGILNRGRGASAATNPA